MAKVRYQEFAFRFSFGATFSLERTTNNLLTKIYQIAMKRRRKKRIWEFSHILLILPLSLTDSVCYLDISILFFIVFFSFLFLSASVLLYLVYGAHARHEQILQIVQYQHSSSPELNWIDGGRPRWSGRRYLSKGFAAPRVPPPWSHQQNWSVNKLTTLITTTTTTSISFKVFCRCHHHQLWEDLPE